MAWNETSQAAILTKNRRMKEYGDHLQPRKNRCYSLIGKKTAKLIRMTRDRNVADTNAARILIATLTCIDG
ncbi:MAG: hypothetical protein OXH76_02275 [Boseongicola sp.]|nr:hypothetical protein [Boseongicola sp.]